MVKELVLGTLAWAFLTGDKRKKDSSLPRGYRNNNPLNIRFVLSNDWDGKVLPNTDGSFEQFTNIVYGYRAALKVIRNYINQGNTTIRQIITRWAPNNENNTEGYIRFVCDMLGARDYYTVDPYNAQQMCDLVYAMAIKENGSNPEPNWYQIYAGYNLL